MLQLGEVRLHKNLITVLAARTRTAISLLALVVEAAEVLLVLLAAAELHYFLGHFAAVDPFGAVCADQATAYCLILRSDHLHEILVERGYLHLLLGRYEWDVCVVHDFVTRFAANRKHGLLK